MGWRGTVVLAVALAAAGAWLGIEIARDRDPLSWDSVLEGRADLPPGDRVTHLLAFDPARITAIRLRRGAQEWRTERRNGVWTGTERPDLIEDFLASLRELGEIMQLDVSADALAEHGLAPPEATIELVRVGEPPLTLLLGAHNPPATGVYAQVAPNGPVVLTGALARWEFDKAARALSATPGAS